MRGTGIDSDVEIYATKNLYCYETIGVHWIVS
jgi:hypothetical protein